jgi:type III secretion system FlhB-like substrate exporter
MKRTIADHKRDILSDLIKRMEGEIGELNSKLEYDENIPEDTYRVYEKQIGELYSLLKEIEEEVQFS